MDSSQIALRLTEKAIQNGLLKKYIAEDSKSVADTAKVIADFYNSLMSRLTVPDSENPYDPSEVEVLFSDEVKKVLTPD